MSRTVAWRCVRFSGGTPLREVDRRAAEAGLDSRDTGLARALVGVEVRRRATLRALVERYSPRSPSPDLAAHMRLGLAQALFLDRVPDHATVSATSEAVARTCGFSKPRYVSAVIRAAIRERRKGLSGDPRRDLIGRDIHMAEPVFRDPQTHPLLWAEDALSIPASLFRRWTKRYGQDRARALAEWFLHEPPLSLRAVLISRDQLIAELESLGVRAERASSPSIVRCPSSATEAVLGHRLFEDGSVTVQGETAFGAANLVGAEPGERVLDLCAAPGGKTAVLAAMGADVTAVDIDPGRIASLTGTLERLGLSERVRVIESDGTSGLEPGDFDAVLVDAPCSNTGVLGARPGARWRHGPKWMAELGALQARLLREAATRVRAGGRLVWSTCSLEPEENDQLVRGFLADHPDFSLAEQRSALPGVDGPGDGGYAALLTR